MVHIQAVIGFLILVALAVFFWRRRSFESDKLQGNLAALVDALQKAKPASSKGVYLRKVAVSSTMGVGVRVDIQSIAALL